MANKEDYIIKGREGKPENGDEIIMWNYSDEPEITEWKYDNGELSPLSRWVFDDKEPGEGEMTWLDSTEDELAEEMGHPTFENALEEYPYWDYSDKDYEVASSIDDFMNHDFNDKFAKCKFYSYYASYFINSDPSGMTDDEIADCEAFESALKNYLETDNAWVVDVLDDSDFGDVEIPKGFRVKSYKGRTFLPGDVCTYVVQCDGRNS